MNPAAGLVQTFIIIIALACVLVGAVTFGITKLSQPKELVVKKKLVPDIRLTTDGKKVDTVFVYKIR